MAKHPSPTGFGGIIRYAWDHIHLSSLIMCGRYVSHVGAMHGWTEILTDWPEQLPLSFNVAPTQMVPVFVCSTGEPMRWGLIAPWAEDTDSRYHTFNARLGTVAEKPTFRGAWTKGQRCLLPARGYYEWRSENGVKNAYFVCRKDAAPVVFAGLFEPARGEQIPASCTILTRPAEGELAQLHHAMPVILEPQHADAWLNGTLEHAAAIAWRDYADVLTYYRVANKVNRVVSQGESLIDPFDEPESQQGFGF